MYKLMQKYNKKLLAIVMVFLMIAFVIPQFNRNHTPGEMPVGQIGEQTITAADVQQGKYLWAVLMGGDPRSNPPLPGVAIQYMDQRTRQPALKPLAAALGEQAIMEIQRHPVMFLLLQREAVRSGVMVADRDVDALLAEIQVRLSDRNVLYDNVKNQEAGDTVREAVRAFLLISTSFDQSASMIKISQPLLARRMAKELQEIKLQMVEFDDKDYTDKVPAPTPEQIQEQFDKFADTLPGQVDAKTNPFAFGYKYPNRVKVAYIGISRDEVKKAIRAGKSDYDWDVEAQKYYQKNGSLFASTQPATTQASDAFSLGAASRPSGKPTTKPFAEVRDTIMEALINPDADKLESAIQTRLTGQMRDDWNAYQLAMKSSTSNTPAKTTSAATIAGADSNPSGASTASADLTANVVTTRRVSTAGSTSIGASTTGDASASTAPAATTASTSATGAGSTTQTSAPAMAANLPRTTLGVPYTSPEYLSRLAEQMQKQFKVVLTVSTRSEKFLTEPELAELPGIGKADAMFAQQPLPFNIYAIQLAEPFMKLTTETSLSPIKVLEPSRPVSDFSGTTYIFRLTDVDPAHRPADSRDVLQKVEEDIRISTAFELAKADATKLLETARASTLRSAAVGAGKLAMAPSFIRARGPLPPDIAVSSLSQQTFVDQAFALLSAAAGSKSTIDVIGLPRDYRLFVAQLADVRRIPEIEGQPIEGLLADEIRGELAQDLQRQWFRWDSLVERMHYTDANKKKESDG